MTDRVRSHGTVARRAFDGPAIATLVALAVVLGGAVLARKPLVAAAPGLASLYARIGLDVNRVGLDLVDVHTMRDVADGAAGIVVEGTIRNPTGGAVEVPPLRLVLLDGAGQRVAGWQAEPDRQRLQPQQTQKFRTRLAGPPDPARTVSVSFALPGTKG